MTKILIRSSVVLTTAFVLAAAIAPVQARTVNVDNNQESAGGSSGPNANGQRQTRYCLVDTVTGSRIPVKVCKTRKEWQAEGVEIPAGR